MNSSGQLPESDLTTRREQESKVRRKRRARKQSGTSDHTSDQLELAPAGSLTRTKALLLAALRVWELKQRVRD